MNYHIELNKDELKALKKFLSEEYESVKALRNNQVFRVEYKTGDSLEIREQELLILLGKLDNLSLFEYVDELTGERLSKMAKDVCENVNSRMCADGTCPQTWDCPYSDTMAKILIEKGWVKPNKDIVVQPTVQSYSTHDNDLVVLSREEYQKDFSSQFNKGYKHGSKETAEKIIHYIDTEIRNYINDSDLQTFEEHDVKWLKKQFNIDVKE